MDCATQNRRLDTKVGQGHRKHVVVHETCEDEEDAHLNLHVPVHAEQTSLEPWAMSSCINPEMAGRRLRNVDQKLPETRPERKTSDPQALREKFSFGISESDLW